MLLEHAMYSRVLLPQLADLTACNAMQAPLSKSPGTQAQLTQLDDRLLSAYLSAAPAKSTCTQLETRDVSGQGTC